MQGLTPAHTGDDALEAYSGQPVLFSELDVSRPVVIAARAHVHTGTTVSADEREAARIIGLAALRWSERRIAETTGHSRNTVSAVLRLAERAGKVEPVKERVLAAAAAAIHSDIELGNQLADDVRNGEAGADLASLASLRRSTWVGAGILADKGTSSPTVQVNVQVGSGSVVQVVEDYRRRQAAMLAPDSESGAVMPEVQQIQGESAPVMPDVMPAQPDSSRSEVGILGASEGRGGGCDSAGGPGDTDGKD
jgi:hypothetical protein